MYLICNTHVYTIGKEKSDMGDLKKKQDEYIAKQDDERIEKDEKTIERLREYMKLFMEKQKEKKKDGD